MCAIFGATKLVDFVEIYKQNLCRGSAAFGGVFLTQSGPTIIKQENQYSYDQMDERHSYFLGHTQAPTTMAQVFSPATVHPFIYGDWVVAHNGVLTNSEALKDQVGRSNVNIVDSSVIPVMLSQYAEKITNPTDVIRSVMNKLEGTFSLWIHNTATQKTYICRCGSTLFMNVKNSSFSSIKLEEMTEVPNSSIFEKDVDGFHQVGIFNQNSPFFIV